MVIAADGHDLQHWVEYLYILSVLSKDPDEGCSGLRLFNILQCGNALARPIDIK